MTITAGKRPLRVRFAPSPTGSLHIGNARTALFNWLIAKKGGGAFVLRIEDTDKERSTKESEESIIKDLKWLGITYDEGPDIGGNFGPYRQSERTNTYNAYLNQLLDSKSAYRCYCTKEELEAERVKQAQNSKMPAYSGKCRNLTKDDEARLQSKGREPVVRLKVGNKDIKFDDIIKGGITFPAGSLGGDFIIVRATGDFMYNFTVVIDDALMRMSHVIRGEDHLTNTIKQIILYNALGFEPPEFAHCPMIVGEDKKRLSKRFLADSFGTFRNDGILPEALMNYIALLGWSSRDGAEIFTRDELIEKFDINHVSKSPSVFSYDKLKWVNGKHIKMMDAKSFNDRLARFTMSRAPETAIDHQRFSQFSTIIKEEAVSFNEAFDFIPIFFADRVPISDDAASFLSAGNASAVVRRFMELLSDESAIDSDIYKKITTSIQKELGVSGKALFMPLRAAITGMTKGPDIAGLCAFMGKDAVIRRLENALK